jgi:hypothetical protein
MVGLHASRNEKIVKTGNVQNKKGSGECTAESLVTQCTSLLFYLRTKIP